jgi:glycosyltransferase involved in cell wall biosynthesis
MAGTTATPERRESANSPDRRLMSVVAPVFNEIGTIEEFHRRVGAALQGFDYELVLVDDASTDGTSKRLRELADRDPRVRVVPLSRNFGHQAALTAGLDHARGNPVVMLDADLQDPPELIPEMVEHWRAGSDVVYAVRRQRAGETAFKRGTASLFYRLFSRVSTVDLQPESGDFRLLDRRPLDALLGMRERSRFLRGMTIWVGYRQTAIPYDRDPRFAGETKYTLRRMLRFSIDAMTAFSRTPLQLATYVGLAISSFAFVAIPVIVVLRLTGHYLAGFATLTIIVLALSGIQLVAIGILGEYLARVFDEVKARPLYVVRRDREDQTDDEDSGQLAPADHALAPGD